MKIRNALLLVLSTAALLGAGWTPETFFAKPETQAKAPTAFATRADAGDVLALLEAEAVQERDALVTAVQADAELSAAVARWATLSIDEQIPFLRRVFALEVEALGITAPELVIQDGVVRGAAYFDFDLTRPGPGRVILSPSLLAAEENPYTSLMLLIHETRHSAQLQRAFAAPSSRTAAAFKASFQAQRDLRGQLTFLDFMTLFNEYEAFQYGNYVVGKLTGFATDTLTMGSFASQYDAKGQPRIDLVALLAQVGPDELLNAFNVLERVQFDAMND